MSELCFITATNQSCNYPNVQHMSYGGRACLSDYISQDNMPKVHSPSQWISQDSLIAKVSSILIMQIRPLTKVPAISCCALSNVLPFAAPCTERIYGWLDIPPIRCAQTARVEKRMRLAISLKSGRVEFRPISVGWPVAGYMWVVDIFL
jgi:hypothetical protein